MINPAARTPKLESTILALPPFCFPKETRLIVWASANAIRCLVWGWCFAVFRSEIESLGITTRMVLAQSHKPMLYDAVDGRWGMRSRYCFLEDDAKFAYAYMHS